MHIISKVFAAEYRDSLFLMKLSNDVSSWPDVDQAVIVMGTESNKRILEQVGLLTNEGERASAHDLVIAARTSRPVEEFLLAIEGHMQGLKVALQPAESTDSLEETLQTHPETSLVMLSVPGEHAADLARQALERNRHVFCFSHHVSIEDEIKLKQMARERNLLMMGPDCGTSWIDGLGLGFANQVPTGPIGIVSASGSGLQEVMSLIARMGGGISNAIGVGGRDMTAEVGGLMTEQAVHFLLKDGQTKVLVILAKKAAPETVRRVLHAAAGIPVVADVVGTEAQAYLTANGAALADTFELCAYRALELAGHPISLAQRAEPRWKEMPAIPDSSRRYLRALFGGGSLCAEARQILERHGFTIQSNLDSALPADASGHILIDFGSEEFTRGSPHPFIDPRQRNMAILDSWDDPEVAVLLLDIVLGWGCHPDPAGEVANLIESARSKFHSGPVVIASVCGTEDDPQGYSQQKQKLEDAGILVLRSNAQATEFSAHVIQSMRGASG